MALIIRDAKIIQELEDGNLHDVPSMVLLREFGHIRRIKNE